jgi:hypothetical protein
MSERSCSKSPRGTRRHRSPPIPLATHCNYIHPRAASGVRRGRRAEGVEGRGRRRGVHRPWSMDQSIISMVDLWWMVRASSCVIDQGQTE